MTDREDYRDRYRQGPPPPGYGGPPTERLPRIEVPPQAPMPPMPPLPRAPYPPVQAPPPVRPAKPKPTRGWRRGVHAATFGLVNPGP
ncbi:MAG: MinD/ParA family protein, partial [Mycolicibacterium aromaticivorans]|nr:MinD/ParA family protein [Mycolicibacterium aromaticivorans]